MVMYGRYPNLARNNKTECYRKFIVLEILNIENYLKQMKFYFINTVTYSAFAYISMLLTDPD